MEQQAALVDQADSHSLGIDFLNRTPAWEFWVKMGVTFGVVALLITAWNGGAFRRFLPLMPELNLANSWVFFAVGYAFIHYAATLWRISLWLKYKPTPPVHESMLPNVSVIIPAFNEGALVKESILSVASSDYPSGRLQVIVVDDGSTDDTWHYVEEAAAESAIPVLTLRHRRNRGKRLALNTGFQKATGEVWVTVDSDSILERDALVHGVSPLVRDNRIGCVAGCVLVLNRNDSLMTRFLKVSFSLSFKFSRAYQSQLRGLLTTPGALSLYRASAVKPILGLWLGQRFLGVACATGEDRALTNLITAQGFHSFFQSSARVWCHMPSRYSDMCLMFLRWARSNIRETVFLLSFLFKPFRREYLWGFRINAVLIASTLIVPYVFLLRSYGLLLANPEWLLHYAGAIAFIAIPMALIYYRNERDSDLVWVIAYEFFWVFACQWIMPYAFLTCRRQGAWLTRDRGNPLRPEARARR